MFYGYCNLGCGGDNCLKCDSFTRKCKLCKNNFVLEYGECVLACSFHHPDILYLDFETVDYS